VVVEDGKAKKIPTDGRCGIANGETMLKIFFGFKSRNSNDSARQYFATR
jgi:hypothetical protein